MSNVNLDMSTLDPDKLKELDEYIVSKNSDESNLIHVLHRAQKIFGYIPPNLQLYISHKLNTNAAKVNGVVSFYSYFTQEKTGKHVVSVCMGTACYVKGAEGVLEQIEKTLGIKKGETTSDGQFTIKDVRCIGACGLAPVVTIGEKVYGHVKANEVKNIFDQFRGDLDE